MSESLTTDQRVTLLETRVNHLEDALAQFLAGSGGAKPTIYSQRDQHWAAITLGTGNTTIGQEGCLMTCAAQMLTECGKVVNPLDLNTWLKNNGGFVQGNHFVFSAIDKMGVVKFRVLGNCVNIPAPVSMLDRVLSSGAYVIAQVDFVPGGSVQQHWVIYRGNGQITDPWYGDNAPITRYGRDAAQAIIGYAIYDKAQP